MKKCLSWLNRRDLKTNLIILLAVVPAAFLIAVPYLWMFTTSLKARGTTGLPPYLFPVVFNFSNYVKAWQAAPFLRYYLNTVIAAFGIISSRILFASMAAYAFSFLRFKFRDLLFLFFLATMMFPFQATIIPSYMIIRDLGWFQSYQALIVPRMVDAFSIFLLRQAFISIPRDYLEAAKLDGCNHWQTLWRVVVPISSASVVTMSLFSFLFAWNDFLWPLLVNNSESMRTIQLGLQVFAGRYQTEWTYMMAGTVTATLLPIILYLIAQKSFISGLSRSGLKG
ncbi:MAG: carbohydrate ABC transporter permease [Anaerolineaceae bacterium]|nr:carbohydrate ABC transporter permease [Anaerolineaceae bacterium]